MDGNDNIIGAKAQALIDRLCAVDFEQPVVDRNKVERAIQEHLQALGLPARPVRWSDNARAARAARAAIDAIDAIDAWYWWRWQAFYSAREAVYWVAAAEASKRDIPEVNKLIGIWLPCADAYEAGLWMYWILESEVIVVPRPAMRLKGEQLHCEDGPAVWWPDSAEKYFFLNGVEVPQVIVETPAAQLDPRMILKESNAEIRREIVRKVGIERVCESLGAKCIDRQGDYELLLLNLGDGRRRPFLKMKNPSIGVFHIEGVEPSCQTVSEALNFRNSLTPEMIDDKEGEEWFQQGDVILRPRGATKFKSQPIVLT